MQKHKEECDRVVIGRWFMEAMGGRIDDIKRLLKRGFKVNSKMASESTLERAGFEDVTALYFTASGGHVEVGSNEEQRDELTTSLANIARARSSVQISLLCNQSIISLPHPL